MKITVNGRPSKLNLNGWNGIRNGWRKYCFSVTSDSIKVDLLIIMI